MIKPTYTPEVKRLADEVRKLTVGELIALQETLKSDWNILPPDIGDREPLSPKPAGGSSGATAELDK